MKFSPIVTVALVAAVQVRFFNLHVMSLVCVKGEKMILGVPFLSLYPLVPKY